MRKFGVSTLPVRQALVLVLACAAPAWAERALTGQTAVTFFAEAQDVPAFTPEQLAARARTLGDEPEAIAADAALNQWKLCVQESLTHWAPLNQGPGTLIDGAFGRCADLERDYRLNLGKMSFGGRQVVDVQLARNLTRTLEDGWRPRLVALALDQALARIGTVAATTGASREATPRTKEERPGSGAASSRETRTREERDIALRAKEERATPHS